MLLALALLVLVAAAFDITNGMNDVTGMLAAPVATGTLRPITARLVVLLGIATGPFIARAAVAGAYASGIVSTPAGVVPALTVLAAAVGGATLWNLLARKKGWPTSSSQALVGALLGAALVAHPQWHTVHWGWGATLATHKPQGVVKVVAALFISPLAGGLAGAMICRLLHWVLRRAHVRITPALRALQAVLLYLQGISYGMNDAQKTMGILAAGFLIVQPAGMSLFLHHGIEWVPWWIKLISVGSIALGALIGSASILKTLSKGVFNFRLTEALAVQAAVTGVVSYASSIGGPVSSGQVLASAIVGAGSVTRHRAVHWAVVMLILKSWIITIPGAALLGSLLMALLRLFW